MPSTEAPEDLTSRALDAALEMTFPASDPVAVTVSTKDVSDVPIHHPQNTHPRAK